MWKSKTTSGEMYYCERCGSVEGNNKKIKVDYIVPPVVFDPDWRC